MTSIYKTILAAVSKYPGPLTFEDSLRRRYELRHEDEVPVLIGITRDTPTLRGLEMLGISIDGLTVVTPEREEMSNAAAQVLRAVRVPSSKDFQPLSFSNEV